jgi:hypothetical protein
MESPKARTMSTCEGFMFHTDVQGSTGRLKLGQTEAALGVSFTSFVRAVAAPGAYARTATTRRTTRKRGMARFDGREVCRQSETYEGFGRVHS